MSRDLSVGDSTAVPCFFTSCVEERHVTHLLFTRGGGGGEGPGERARAVLSRILLTSER